MPKLKPHIVRLSSKKGTPDGMSVRKRKNSMHRVGIIPFDMKDHALAILFVTSQTRGRWILPKGVAKKNETHVETCHREGFEEAGVRGIVFEDFPLTILISKQTRMAKEQVPVTYYPYLVLKQEDDWPDQVSRQRHWALLEDATKVTYREDFLALIRQFESLVPWIREVAESYKSEPPKKLMQAR